MATITIHVPDQESQAYSLEGADYFTVGREDCSIIIDHDSISGAHAAFRLVDGTWQLEDQESTNGTFVEGEAITAVQLAHGNRITFGSVPADFELPGSDAEQELYDAVSGGEGEDSAAPDGPAEGTGHEHAETAIAEKSVRPAGFNDLSPIEKVEKKDTLGMVALIVGVVAIVAALALVVLSTMMTSA